MQSELRKNQRHKIALDVQVQAPIACSLADVSALGARLSVDRPAMLPDEFMLVLRKDLRRWCRIKWRSETEVGVEFIAMPDARVLLT